MYISGVCLSTETYKVASRRQQTNFKDLKGTLTGAIISFKHFTKKA